jgi:hypothetical protein
MKKSTSITYNIETCEGISTRELEYKDYVKNEKGEENLLHYKVRNVMNSDETREISDASDTSDASNAADTVGNIKVIRDMNEMNEMNIMKESFNKIYRIDNTIDETVGISSNSDDWKIHEYKNHKLDKAYIQGYDTIKFDIKSEMLEKYDKQYIKDN